MELLILLLIAGIIGYLLSGSRYSRRIDETTGRVASSSEGYIEKTGRWIRTRFGRGKQANAFLGWATGAGATHFPEDFKSWLGSLTLDEADQFTRALVTYTQSLGYRLEDYESGKMDSKPTQMQIFVEAVVIYSNEYRKAHQAQLEAKKAEETSKADAKSPDSSPTDGKAVAEKQPSRRKSAVGENAQPSVAA
jgi:hypothetical protein